MVHQRSVTEKKKHCGKSVKIRRFFWSVFSYIQTEYADLLYKSMYLVRIQENTNQKRIRVWISRSETNRMVEEILLYISPLKFSDLFSKFWKHQRSLQVWFHNVWKYQRQKRRTLNYEAFLLITLVNSTPFLIHSRTFHMLYKFVIFNPWKASWNWIAFYQNSFVISPGSLYHLIRRDPGRLTNEAFTANPIVSSKQ